MKQEDMRAMNAFQLKLIGILTMLSDHVGKMFFPQEATFQFVGRIAFPLFAWSIANGYRHTRDVRKYLIRLFVFALLSQVPFTLVVQGFSSNPLDYLTSLNVMFTLFLGLAGIVCYERIANKFLGLSVVLALAILAGLLRTDYGTLGVLSIFLFYVFYHQYGKLLLSQFLLFVLLYSQIFFTQFDPVMLLLAICFVLFATVALLLIMVYNGKPGPRARYLFYIFYPVHLLVLYGIQQILLLIG